jgi:hypothetical protein
MDDIICTMPEACGEKDCPVGWHLAHYWAYDDGTYSVCDSDGNHDDCDESEVPTCEQQEAAWLDYSRHVAATGSDPLGEFKVPRVTKRKERYTAAFRLSILGAALVAVRRGGKVVPLRDLPQRVADYLCVERLNGAAGNLRFTDGWQSLLAIPEVKMHRGTARVTFTLDHEEPRPEAAVEADLRKAARRHLHGKKSKA